MTTSEWKRAARILKSVYAELEEKAKEEGVDIFSDEYNEIVEEARISVLKKLGFSLAEYRTAAEEIEGSDA
jgi:ribosomal protein L31E